MTVPSDRIATPPLPCSLERDERRDGGERRRERRDLASPPSTMPPPPWIVPLPMTTFSVHAFSAAAFCSSVTAVGSGAQARVAAVGAHEAAHHQHQGQRGGGDAHEAQGARPDRRADGPFVGLHDLLLDRVEARRGRGLPVRGGERVCVPEPSLQSIVHHRASFRSTPG